nr:phosphotransferase [Burkholderia glumae]
MMESDVETPESWLHRHWGLWPAHVRALSSGHTNKSFRVDAANGAAVLRVSWAGKAAAQVRREVAALAALAGLDASDAWRGLPAVPRLRETVDARPGVRLDDGRWLHLFEAIDGEPGLPDDARAGTIAAMRALAPLHAALNTLPSGAAAPAAWLDARFARVAARPAPACLAAEQRAQYAAVIDRIGAHLAAAARWLDGPTQWLHGDYHAGNLLFADGVLRGVLDFDDMGQGAPWLEAAFAAFALSRDASVETHFVFDTDLRDAGLAAYAAGRGDAAPGWLVTRREAVMMLFCAEQTLIHLEAAQRGLWTPGPGIGFLGGWRQLLDGAMPIG